MCTSLSQVIAISYCGCRPSTSSAISIACGNIRVAIRGVGVLEGSTRILMLPHKLRSLVLCVFKDLAVIFHIHVL
jgi:hypothetical protein